MNRYSVVISCIVEIPSALPPRKYSNVMKIYGKIVEASSKEEAYSIFIDEIENALCAGNSLLRIRGVVSASVIALDSLREYKVIRIRELPK